MHAHKEPVSSNYPDRCREAEANYELPSQQLDSVLQAWFRNNDDEIASSSTECPPLSEATKKKESIDTPGRRTPQSAVAVQVARGVGAEGPV